MRRLAVVALRVAVTAVVPVGAVASVASAGCRSQESRVCDADRADLVKAVAALEATKAKPDDLQKHKDLRDQLLALAKRIELNRIPRLATEDPSELTMRALDKLVMAEVSLIEALDPVSKHPLAAMKLAEKHNAEAREELLVALGALRAQCER